MDNQDVLAAPTAMRFGNDVVIPEPSSTNTKNYSVLTSDAAKQDYQLKNTWLSNEQNNLINQSLQNQTNTAANKTAEDANAATKANADAINGATKALAGSTQTTASGNTYTSTGDSYNDQLSGQMADAAAMYKQTQTALAKASTIAGLSPDQQAQLNNLSTQYDQLITQQTQANNMYEGGVTMSTVRGGSDRYAQTVAASTVKQAVDQGIAKITNIQNQKSSALQKMQEGFISDNVKSVNEAYKQYSDFVKQQNDTIKEMQDHVQKMQDQILAQQKEAFSQNETVQKFSLEHNIKTPFYVVGGTLFNSSTMQPATMEDYKTMTGTDQFDPQFVSEPQSQLKAGDTEITEANGRRLLINSVTGETIKDLGSSINPKTGSSAAKLPSITDVRKYDLPSWVSKDDFNAARNELMNVRKTYNLDQMTEAQKADMWGKSADYFKNQLGLDPQDFDALLWETYSPKGLAGYRQYVQNVKPKASSVDQLTTAIYDWMGTTPPADSGQ